MSDQARIVVLVILVAIVGGCAWFIFRPPIPVDSVHGLARYCGVDERAVEEVAEAYGVPLSQIGNYGDGIFPVNYIESALGWKGDQRQHPTVYRSDIEALVTGYVSKCDFDDTITLYLFYSDWLHPRTLFHGQALPMQVTYELDVSRQGVHDDQVVQNIRYYELRDSGGLPWEQVAQYCMPPARY